MAANSVDWHDALRMVEGFSRAEQLQLITTLLQRMQDDVVRDNASEEPIDLLTLAGMGADLWAAVDVDAYLQLDGRYRVS